MTDDALLRDSGLPLHEAERLLMAVTGRSRSGLYTGGAPTAGESARFARLVVRRRAGEPLQYLERIIPFGPADLRVDGRALIPRPETEYLWEQASQVIGGAGSGTRIVDLCTGSGALAVALKKAFPEARITATDLSEEALVLAAENAAMNDLAVDFYQGDLFSALPAAMNGRIDLLVTNPPYVSEAEYRALPDEIRSYGRAPRWSRARMATRSWNASPMRSTGGWPRVVGSSARSVRPRASGRWSCSAAGCSARSATISPDGPGSSLAARSARTTPEKPRTQGSEVRHEDPWLFGQDVGSRRVGDEDLVGVEDHSHLPVGAPTGHLDQRGRSRHTAVDGGPKEVCGQLGRDRHRLDSIQIPEHGAVQGSVRHRHEQWS
ncbi:MAG: HemK family protein methyltransferase [Gammaproteobacteria bacterium]|nr:HemK family protein methyltransferase [Gammaproteobacteria bacterium]